MTSPNSDRPPEGRRFWRIVATSLGVGTLIIGTAVAVGAWLFINRGLTPLLERQLSTLLERELELGDLEGLSLNGLRVGPSRLGATETDPSYATAEAVEVGFSTLQVLFRRELEIDLTLIGTKGYIEQHPDEGWLGIDVPTFEPVEDPFIKVRMDDIEVIDSQVTAVPLPADGATPTPLVIDGVNGSVTIEPVEVNGQGSQRVEFNAIATPPQGGNLDITGAIEPMASGKPENPIQQEIKIGIGGEGVAAEPALAFLLPTLGQQNLPLAAIGGRASGQWTITFLPEQPVTVDGAGSVDNGQLQLTSLPNTGPWGNTIENIDATARFQGTTITVDRARGSYENLTATAAGTIDWNGDYDLTAQVADVDLEQLLERSEVDVPIALSGVLDSSIAITGPILQPQISADVAAIGPVVVDRIVLNDLSGNVVLAGERIEDLFDQITVTQINATPELGGQLTGSGVLNLAGLPDRPPELDFNAEVTNVSGDAIASLYEVDQLPVTLGIVGATASITGPPNAVVARINAQAPALAYGGQIYPASATAVFADGGLDIPQALVQVGTGTLTGTGNVGTDSWQANIIANNVDLRALSENVPGNLNADVALAGPLQGTSLETLLAMGNYSLQLTDGSVQGTAELANGSWQTDATLRTVGLGQFASQLGGNANGTVRLEGDVNARTLAELRGQGDLTFSAGLAGFSPQLAGFDAPVSSRFAWTGQELLIEQANSAQLQARGVISPQFEGNQFQGIRGFSLDLDAQRYPLALLPSPIPLDGFASLSNGRLVGTLSNPQFSGTLLLEDFGVNQVAFDPVLLGPVNYQLQTGLVVDLDGQNGPAVPDGLADGIAINFQNLQNFDFDVSWQGAQASGRTDGDVLRTTLLDLPLQALGLPAVERLGGGLRGTLSSQGEWIVDLNRQTLMGDVFIAQPGLGYLNAQQLTGQVAYRDRRVLVEQGELIFNACSLQLATDNEPQPNRCSSIEVANSIYQFDGSVQLDTLAYNANVDVKNGDVRDVLTALAIVDLEDLIQTFQPPTWLENQPSSAEIPQVLATQPTGNSEATLLDQLRRLAEIQKIQDQVALAEEENPIPPLNELQGRFDATVRLSGRPQQLPEIVFDVEGQSWTWTRDFVADRVIAQGQLANGNLTLQPLRLETALSSDAAPDAEDSSQLAFVNLAGNLSLVEQDSSSLQLVAEQLPVAAVKDIFNLPVGLQGRLNGIANFSGGLDNPTVRGDIILADGSINNQPIEQAEGLFLYEDARLILQGELLQVNNPQPLTLVGDIPYAFDFMKVQPADDRIALTLDVADEGLALLNALNNQVLWESGKGQVSLEIGGSLSSPTVSGAMRVQEAVLRSPLLPDPLTNFEGEVVFENNQINVLALQGTYGNGQLQAAGSFPLVFPFVIDSSQLALLGADASGNALENEAGTPISLDSLNGDASGPPPVHSSGALTVTLDNVDLDLRGIYRGGVKGQVVVGGSLLGGPQLGGVVELANGRLFLPEGGNTAATSETPEISRFVPQFENLKITLANNIQIQQTNLLNVVAQGDLNVTGPLRPFRALEPEGTIRLRSGRINLLTTTFRLAGRNNTARFLPERGIADPLLDIQLRTSVAETQQNNAVEATAFASSSEIADTSIDPFQGTTELETIRIRARYEGSASNLLESLFLSDISDAVIEFSSSPPRSRQEIVNLLSGSYIAALQSGQGVLNFFGGALLNSLQDFIISTLNLSEFRLFPVTGASRFSSEENSGSTLDVATEVGFDVTNNVTLSLVKILTDNTPTEFNLRYRLTDEFTVRGTTNFDDRNRVLLEFETRF